MTTELRVRHVPRHRRPGLPRRHGSGRAGVLRNSAVMAFASVISRLLGFVRNFLFGSILAGSMSAAANAYSAANTLPNTIWVLVGGGTLNAILVPAIVRAIKAKDHGSDYISRLMTLVALAGAVLVVACMIAVPALILLTSGVLPPATYALAVQMGLWMVPQIFFFAMYVMCGQLLNAHESFGPFQWAPALNNLVAILGAGIFLGIWGTNGLPSQWTPTMVLALAAINLLGSIAQVLFLLYYVRLLGLNLRPKWGFRGLGLGKLSRLGMWTLGMLVLGQIGLWATRWSTGGAVKMAEHYRDQPELAAQYPGLLTIEWAFLAFMIPQGIIAVSLVTAVFPGISSAAADGKHDRALLRYAETNRLLAVPMVLCTVVFMALAAPIMWVIGGGTGRTAAEANGTVLVAYMLGLVPFSALYLIKRVFYSYEDARTPFMMQIPIMLLHLAALPVVLFWVDPRWATAAAAGAGSLSNVVAWLMGLYMLRRHAHSLGAHLPPARGTIIMFTKLSLVGAATWGLGVLAVYLLGDLFWVHRLVAILLGAVVGGLMTAVFLGLGWVARIDELQELVRMARRPLRKLTRRGARSTA